MICSSNWTDKSNFKDPGFYSVLDSRIPVLYQGKVTTLSALPEAKKKQIREKACATAFDQLGSVYGKYEFTQIPTGHSVNCGDWTLDLYDKVDLKLPKDCFSCRMKQLFIFSNFGFLKMLRCQDMFTKSR